MIHDCGPMILTKLHAISGLRAEAALQPDHVCVWYEPVPCLHGVTYYCHPTQPQLAKFESILGAPPDDIACPRAKAQQC